MKKMKRLSFLFSMLFAFLIVPKFCLAATVERTTTLDLSSLDLTVNQENVDEGWSFNASDKTLTLTDINFNVPGARGISIPGDMDVKIILVGENKIAANSAIAQDFNTTGTVTITGSGSLEMISYVYSSMKVNNLVIESGKIIANGEIDIKTKKNGIMLDVSNNLSAGTMLGIKITGGTINIDAEGYGIRYDTSSLGPGVVIPSKDILLDGANIDFKNTINCISSDE